MRVRKAFLIFFLVFVALGVYYPTLFAEFTSVDDFKMVTHLENTDKFDVERMFFGERSRATYYRPLLYLTFIMDKYVWGLSPSFMHLENILLHALNVVLIFLVAGRMFSLFWRPSPIAAFLAALLFALHPVNTEAVNWISSRTDVLAGTFLFTSLYLLLRSFRSYPVPLVLSAAFSFLLASLCKESAVFALPGFLFIIFSAVRLGETQPDEGSAALSVRSALFSGCSLALAAGAYFLIRHNVLGGADGGVNSVVRGVTGKHDVFSHTLWLAGKAFGFYVKKLFIPWPQSFTITHVSDVYIIVGACSFLVLLYLLFRRGIISSCLIFSACIIAPALLVPLGAFAWTPLAERYLYMATPTFCIALTYVGASLTIKERWIPCFKISFALLIATLIWSVYNRNTIWQSNLTLFQDCVRKNPDFAPARNDLAFALNAAGKGKEAREIYLSNSLPRKAKYSIITNINKARAMAEKGKVREAKAMLLKANYPPSHPLYPKYLETLIYLDNKLMGKDGLSLEEKKALQYEVISYLTDLGRVTKNPVHYYTIGQNYISLGDKEKALHFFQLAYKKSKSTAYYYNAVEKIVETLSK